MTQDTHIFAFFVAQLDCLVPEQPIGSLITVTDEQIIHRMHHVVKIKTGEHGIFFNNKIQITGEIRSISKHEIVVFITHTASSKPFVPHILLYLPLLKRTNLEEAVYLAAESSVSEIQLVITEKSAQTCSDHEYNRLQKMIIAACEQAKYFSIPPLHKPKDFNAILNDRTESKKIYFDASGLPFFSAFADIKGNKQHSFALFAGPEGGLTHREKELLEQHLFTSCCLTPTVLRAKMAAGIGIAILRTLVK